MIFLRYGPNVLGAAPGHVHVVTLGLSGRGLNALLVEGGERLGSLQGRDEQDGHRESSITRRSSG
jgi:hypothetical protein